jgi:hypothetical protein
MLNNALGSTAPILHPLQLVIKVYHTQKPVGYAANRSTQNTVPPSEFKIEREKNAPLNGTDVKMFLTDFRRRQGTGE